MALRKDRFRCRKRATEFPILAELGGVPRCPGGATCNTLGRCSRRLGSMRDNGRGLPAGLPSRSLLEPLFHRSRRWTPVSRRTIPVWLVVRLTDWHVGGDSHGWCCVGYASNQGCAVGEVRMNEPSFTRIYHLQVIESTRDRSHSASSAATFYAYAFAKPHLVLRQLTRRTLCPVSVEQARANTREWSTLNPTRKASYRMRARARPAEGVSAIAKRFAGCRVHPMNLRVPAIPITGHRGPMMAAAATVSHAAV